MKPAEYLDAAKARLKLETDYALAKAMDTKRARISEIRSGDRSMPLDMAFRIAITLEMDPAQVVADLEEQREKNPKRQGFWRSFTSRAHSSAVAVLCMLALIASATFGNGQGVTGGGFSRRRQCA